MSTKTERAEFNRLMSEAKSLFSDLSDCSGLTDLEGFGARFFGLVEEFNAWADAADPDEFDSEVDRAYAISEALDTAGECVMNMAEEFTEAHMALSNAL